MCGHPLCCHRDTRSCLPADGAIRFTRLCLTSAHRDRAMSLVPRVSRYEDWRSVIELEESVTGRLENKRFDLRCLCVFLGGGGGGDVSHE